MPRVSVISIALSQNEFDPLQRLLVGQSFQDFEFIGEVGGTIPEAWNRAIARAKGDILVFTETDATPVNKYWLEELVNSVNDKKSIVKGLEITNTPLDLSNLACHRDVLSDVRFDEAFRWAEDTELFCRLKSQGYRLIQLDKAPVIHLHKMGRKRMIRRAFRYGVYHARLRHRYSNPVEVSSAMDYLKILLMAAMNLIGYVWGMLIYWPERRRNT